MARYGHSKCIRGVLRHSGTQRALGHLGTQGTWVLEALGRSNGTWTHGHSKGTSELKHSDINALGHSKHSWHFT